MLTKPTLESCYNLGMNLPGKGQLSLGLPQVKKRFKFKVKESQVEMAICHYFRIRGFFFWKNVTGGFFDRNKGKHGSFRKQASPYAINGTPDIILVHKGIFYGIEVKAEKGIQSTNQVDFQKDLEKHGGKYFIARSIDDAEQIANQILAAATPR